MYVSLSYSENYDFDVDEDVFAFSVNVKIPKSDRVKGDVITDRIVKAQFESFYQDLLTKSHEWDRLDS